MFHRYSTQSSFLKYEQYHPGEVSHYYAIESQLNGKLDIDSLQLAFARVVAAHDMLRCSITNDQGEFTLNIHNKRSAHHPIEVIDISDHTSECTDLKKALATAQRTSFLSKPFDLENGPLWRAILVKTGQDQYQFGFLCHPLIADYQSIQIFFNEIGSHYNQNNSIYHRQEKNQTLYPDIQSVDDAARLEYWRKKLDNLTITKLHTPKAFTGGMQFHGKQKPFTLSADSVRKLKAVMPKHTLEEIALTSLFSLLHRYTGETDITIGTSDANRSADDNHINACANFLPVRLDINKDEEFTELLEKTALIRTEAKAHQASIEDIYQYALSDQVRPALRTMAPFDVLLKCNDFELQLNLNDVHASPPKQVDLGYIDTALFQLTLNQLNDGSCAGFINYNTDLFDDEAIDRLIGHWQRIMLAAGQNPQCNVHDIPLLLEQEAQEIAEFNNNDKPSFFNDLMTPDAFHAIAKQIPNQTALAFHPLDDETLRMSFQELEIYTNQIANFLLTKCNLKKGDCIAFSINRSINLVAFTLGALKAGLVIAPLETSAGTLLEYKLKHANPAFILTDRHTHPLFQHQNNTFVLNIDNPFTARMIAKADASFHSPDLAADTPAYIMFSSGTSTGIPKASLLTHGGLANLFHALRHQNYPSGLKVLCTALPTFDAFLFDFLAAWSNEGTVHLTSDEERYSPEAVERIIRNEKINFAVFLPDLMSLLPADLPLDYTISMGAAPREGTFDRWLASRPERKIINGLGHTETGICLSLQDYKPGADSDLVGSPINNMKMFVLNPEHYTQCPIGVPGEIFVAGPGLASEYLGNPELTRNKFLTMKFDRHAQKFQHCDARDPDAIRLYASGDFGCYQATNDGKLSIKSIGRTDRRIKLFGVSIDLDGVETLISCNPQVQAAAVIPKPDMSGLLAYIVRNKEFRKIPADKARNELRQHLRSTLLHPVAYPKRTMFMTELPKTANGKVDLKKLPLPPERELAKPRSNQDILHTLAGMWREVLGSDDADDIDPDKPFQELGGNSIALAMLECRINRDLPLTRRIGFGGSFLSPKMSLHSLSSAIRPLLKYNVATPSPASEKLLSLKRQYSSSQTLFPKPPEGHNMGTIKTKHVTASRSSSQTIRK